MLKSLVKALGIVAGLSMSGWVCAVGMGGINLTTALGEPLKLEIELETASKAETNSLSVRLASPEMFKAAGIDYPYSLPQLKFQIATHANNDQPYLVITSLQPINEPFVTLLVELSWPSGKLLREYTFLLDPPGYAADLPKAAEVKPVEPDVTDDVVQIPAEDSAAEQGVTSEIIADTIPATPESAEEESVPPTLALETAPPKAEETPAASSNVASGPITVKRGDTLYQIASQAKTADANLSEISLEQMLVALYRANQQAFVGKNMNRLRTGQILRIPDQLELEQLSHKQAVKEIRTQTADWNAYRQRLAAASSAAKEASPSQEASGRVSATVSDQTPAPKEAPKEVVRLSKGEAPGDKTTGAGKATKSAQDKINAQQEEAIAQSKAIEENKARAALLEKNIAAMQRLIELKNQPNTNQAKTDKLGALPKMSAASATAAAGAASSVNAASGVQAASAVATASPKIKTQTAPSLLDQLLGEPLYLVAVAALLLLGGLAVWWKRRTKGKGKSDSSDEDIGSASGRIAAPIAPSPDTGDFTTTMVDAGSTNKAATDDVDPISEADLFLNFGRDEQAEEILKDALAKNPANHQIHLKLLSIYLNRRDVAAFSAIASQLQKSGDTKAWEQAAKMGLKLEPNNPMYGADSSSSAAPVAAKDAKDSKDTEVIFDVGIPKKQPAAMDFDLGLATAKVPTSVVEPQHDSTLIMNAPMDFDVTGSRPAAALNTEAVEPSATQMDDLIFDVTAGHEAVAAAPKEEAKKDEGVKPDDDLSFALDIPGIEKFAPPPPPAPSKPPMEINFTEISLNLNEPAAASGATAAADGKDANWQDVATKLDLASAYKEMGDAAGAREILEEVVRDGDDEQRAAANALMQQLG